MTDTALEHVDVLIIGAGPVGMTLHLALAAGGVKSVLLDRRSADAQQADPRALALSHGARQLLEQIHAWPNRVATPIETIHVSQKDGFGRTLIDRADYDLPALGYVVRYRDLVTALAANLAPTSLRAINTSRLRSTTPANRAPSGAGLWFTPKARPAMIRPSRSAITISTR